MLIALFTIEVRLPEDTWRIIPVSNWLVTPIYSISHLAHWEGEYPYLGDLLTMVIDHLLHPGMILQVLT